MEMKRVGSKMENLNLNTQIGSKADREDKENDDYIQPNFICKKCGLHFWTTYLLSSHLEKCTGAPPTSDHMKVEEEEDDEDEEEEDDEDEEEEEEEDWNRHDDHSYMCGYCATISLEFFNEDADTKYELVAPGPTLIHLYSGLTFHINFIAKKVGSPLEEIETFFATLTQRSYILVNSCVSLGPTPLVPHWKKPELGGCKFCRSLCNTPSYQGTLPGLHQHERLLPSRLPEVLLHFGILAVIGANKPLIYVIDDGQLLTRFKGLLGTAVDSGVFI